MEKKIIADEMRHSMEAVITLSVVLNRRRLDQKGADVIPRKPRDCNPLPKTTPLYSSL